MDAATTAATSPAFAGADGGEPPVAIAPLPDIPESQRGSSTAASRNWRATVSNASGYLCRIELEAEFPVPPQVLFEVFTHPDNAAAFRDIKAVGYRKVLEARPGYKVVEVEQLGELRVLWASRVFKTYLRVVEDATRAPGLWTTEFTLLHSDVLARFKGAWSLTPLPGGLDPATGAPAAVTGCRAVLEQEVLPRGVPSFFVHLPVLGGLLRRVSLGAITRVVEDAAAIAARYAAAGPGATVDGVLTAIARERGHATEHDEERPPRPLLGAACGGGAAGGGGGARASSWPGRSGGSGANGANGDSSSHVASFALDSFSDDDGDDEEEALASDASGGGGGANAAAAAAAAAASLSAGGASSSSAGGDGEVVMSLVLPSGGGGGGGGGGGAAMAAGAGIAAAGALKAATMMAPPPPPKHQRRHHHHHQQREAPLLCVLLDVDVSGRVQLLLVPTTTAADACA